nr:immunoglobulin heavy chain junction region [Macaca mulatta]MOX60815.1 immunoglobulin heavy chain junction region [Macaca mulatta]MOX66445.1 immunoglobulin heavy chain junction region [Macaca mulatta]
CARWSDEDDHGYYYLDSW